MSLAPAIRTAFLFLTCALLAAAGPPSTADVPPTTRPAPDKSALIEAHRKSDCVVHVVDTDGNPVEGAKANIELTRHAFLFGCSTFLWGRIGDNELEQAYRERFVGLFNYGTLPFYWASYEPEPGQPQHDYTARVARWCAANGIAMKGHPLAWNYDDPDWLPHDSKEILRLQLARIRDCVNRFDGLINRWDVVNEATHFERASFQAKAPKLTRVWIDLGRYAFARQCFRAARRANPDAALLINDYRTGPQYVEMLEHLVGTNGQPLFDAIGIQSHMHTGVWSEEKLQGTCDRFARFGVPIHFTELTVLSGQAGWDAPGEDGSWPSTPEGEAAQAREVERIYRTLFAHPAVAAITWWDLSDRGAWREAPAGLLRADMSPKPAYDTLERLIHEEWCTKTEFTLGPGGTGRFRGFYGTYEITVLQASGRARRGTFRLERERKTPITVTVR